MTYEIGTRFKILPSGSTCYRCRRPATRYKVVAWSGGRPVPACNRH